MLFSVTQTMNGILAVETMGLSLTDDFPGHDHADFADAADFRIEHAFVELTLVDDCA